MNRERRKALQAIVDQLETLQMQLEEIQTEEEEYRDNIPENFQSGERYERTEEIWKMPPAALKKRLSKEKRHDHP